MSKVSREPAFPGLHISMFGRFRVEIDGVSLKPHRPTDLRALACLLLHHDSPWIVAPWQRSGKKRKTQRSQRRMRVPI
ncbi:MAG: hypothetical protein JWL77_4866 [Chthonomonadaceae bacterium]|nr:hypothetical protein [Chthonomonadaceae bacterium]